MADPLPPPGRPRPTIPSKRRIVISVTVLLVVGFLVTSLSAYLVSSAALQKQAQTSGLPLTSDNIYSDIRNDLLPPVLVSATMALDTFLRDWVLDGERDLSRVIKYLTEVRSRNNTITAFFVSDTTRHYYHPTGIVEQVTREDPTDSWYFELQEISGDYVINVDHNQADDFDLAVFINHKVYDYDENFIGATGVGLQINNVQERLDGYEARYDRDIYFVDRNGWVTLQASSGREKTGNIKKLEGLEQIAAAALATDHGSWEYQREGQTILVNTRFIPEFDWYLFVEQPAAAVTGPIRYALIANLGLGLVIATLVVALIYLSVQNYQRRLERLATTDSLTGVLNRHGFEMLTASGLQNRPPDAPPSCVILVDLDQLKEINDRHGHLVGDELIREVALEIQAALRGSDFVCRWGGEEFVAWLQGCQIEDALAIAETVRARIAARRYAGIGLRVTASLGVVAHRSGDSLETTLGRADRAMYDAKAQGRDRVTLGEA